MKKESDSVPADWVARMADVTLAVGSPTFGEALLQAANSVVRVDHCLIFTFHRQAPSGCLLSVGSGDFRLSVRLAGDYLSGPYADDPNLRRLQDEADPHAVVRFGPQQVPKRWRKHFLEPANIIDTIACFASKDERSVYCNFFRLGGAPVYSDREVARLEPVVPVLASLAAVHYSLCGPLLLREQLNRLRTPDDEVRLLAERLGPSGLDELTERERQVCFRILLGYSSEAIGFNLGIATSTVITHRKRAYQKLGIVSQNELFSLYLHSLPGFVP